MTKTPEELTEDWKAGKLAAGYYYIKFKNGEIETRDNLIGGFLMNIKNPIVQVIAPVPTYDEYKAMQAELAEHRRYCCCSENEVMRLKLAEMEELLKECNNELKILIMLSLPTASKKVLAECNDLLTRINTTLGGSEEK